MEDLKYAYTLGPFPTGDPVITRLRQFLPKVYSEYELP